MLDCLPDQQSIAHSQVRLWKHVEQHSVSFTWESASHECLTALDAHKRGRSVQLSHRSFLLSLGESTYSIIY